MEGLIVKKYVVSMILLFLLAVSVSAFAETNESYFCNGTDTVQIGTYQFYSNSEDEDKLYKYDENTRSETKVCDDHIISLLKNSVDEIYFLSYENGITKLKQYKQNGSIEEIKSVNEIVNSFAIRDNIIYFVRESGIYKYDLNNRNDAEFISNENIAFLYFPDYSTLKYYIKNSDLSYDAKEYNFYEDNTSNKKMKLFSNPVTLMSANSYSPRLTAPATDNPYYTSLNVFHTSGYGMVGNGGNCTCYAYGRSYENLGYKPSLSTANAENWYNYNINNGFYGYGKTPYLGAVAVWAKGVIGNSSDGAGHVAVVEVIDGDTVTTSESGWKSFYFKTVTRSASNYNFSASSSYTFQGFIYVMGQVTPVVDTEKPSISNIYTSNVSGSSFDINCDLNDNIGVTRVWLNVYGPNGSNGYGVTASNGHFAHTINTSDYGGSGTYTVHVYAFDAAGNSTSTAITDISAVSDTENPVICNAYASNISSNSFTINCEVYDNVAVTRAYIIVYGPGGNSGNGFSINVFNNFSYTINTADYGGSGKYNVHVYIWDAQGNSTSAAINGIQAVSDSESPVICDLRASNISSSSFTINCDVYDNVAVTRAYIIVYGPGGNSGNGFSINVFNNFSYTINTADYGGRGKYNVHVYVWDSEGNSTSAAINGIQAISDAEAPVMCLFYPSNISSKQFTINCDVYDNIAVTRAYIIVWGPGGNSGNGFSINVLNNFNYTINTSDYGGAGQYSIHVYLFDADGNQTGAALNNIAIGDDSTPPQITEISVTSISDRAFTINCTANETIVRGWVNIYGPNKSDGYAVSMYGTNFMHTINTDEYGGPGEYEVHVYIWDVNGNEGSGRSTGKFIANKLYTITYNSNGGSVSPTPQTKIHDKNLVLDNQILTRPGYIFWGWAENNPNATNATYPAGGTFTGNYDTTLYAVWRLADYTVSFNANGGATPLNSKTVTYNGKYGSLPVPSLDGHTFIGWFTEPNGGIQVTEYTDVTETDNHTLYAQWKKSEYSIEYNMNGGEGYIASQSITYGANATISSYIPTREGYKFLGWSRISDAIAPEFSAGDIYTENTDITLYAVWKIIPSTKTTIIKKSNYSMVNIMIHNLDESANVVLATYKNGMLSDIQIEEYNGEDLSLATFLPYDTIKVMLWENMNTMNPLCKNEVLHY